MTMTLRIVQINCSHNLPKIVMNYSKKIRHRPLVWLNLLMLLLALRLISIRHFIHLIRRYHKYASCYARQDGSDVEQKQQIGNSENLLLDYDCLQNIQMTHQIASVQRQLLKLIYATKESFNKSTFTESIWMSVDHRNVADVFHQMLMHFYKITIVKRG